MYVGIATPYPDPRAGATEVVRSISLRDLAYVFAFSQLVALLINEPTWAGAGNAAPLFTLL